MSSEALTREARAQLEQELADLRRQLAELGRGEEGLSYDPNFADTSQVTAERGEAEALAVKLESALAEVEHALGKLDTAEYGKCEDCGEAIAEARLEAMPAARFCINCASRH